MRNNGKMIFWWDMDGPIAKWDENDTPEDTWKKYYFRYRELMPRTVETINQMAEEGFDVRILGAAYNEECISDKNWWFDHVAHLDPRVKRVFVRYGTDKADVAKDNGCLNILVDDHTPNLNKWEEAGNCGIKFHNHINCKGTNGKKSWKGNVVSYTLSSHDLFFAVTSIAAKRMKQAHG